MEQNAIRILIIGLIVIIVRIIIKNIKSLRKTNLSKFSPDELDYNDILDYITDLSIAFDGNNREKYTNQQLVVIATMFYYDEVMNGGLCQFFVNSSRIFAPILSISLKEVNAYKHKSHFDQFIKQNGINVKDLDTFISKDVDEFIGQYDRYPFDEFDIEFYDIDKTEKLCDLIIEYARNNRNEIFTDIKK